MRKILKFLRFFKPIFCEKIEIAAVQKDANLVELEKCCQTHILLQNFVLIQSRTSPLKICKNFQPPAPEKKKKKKKKQKKIQQFLTKILRLESGAKECIVQISARAFQRVFTCKIWLRYSRERAYLILINFSSLQRFNFDRALASRGGRREGKCRRDRSAIRALEG